MQNIYNFKLTIQYDGRGYCGWQRQLNGVSIQEKLEFAVEKISKVHCMVTGSGRTDAGVHAHAQIANVKIPTELDDNTLKRAFNSVLPPEIRITKVNRTTDDFHACHSALEKTYRYLLQSGSLKSPFSLWYAYWVADNLNMKRMIDASRHLIGNHDFAAFMATGSTVKSTVRTIKSIEFKRGGGLTSIMITADGFLRHMVRIIVGTLIEVGKSKIDVDRMKEILISKDRKLAGPTAPAEGLTLLRVVY